MKRMTTFAICFSMGAGLAFGPAAVLADDDWEDYWEDYYEDLEEAREKRQEAWEDYQEDLEDYYEDLEDSDRYRFRAYGYGGYTAEPYWYYPPEYHIFGGHPSRYYYTYPDRYYSQRYRYDRYPQYRQYRDYRSDPNIWRYDQYGYRSPYQERRYYERDDYRYRGRGDGYYRYQDRYRDDGYRRYRR